MPPVVPCALPDRRQTPLFRGQNQAPANRFGGVSVVLPREDRVDLSPQPPLVAPEPLAAHIAASESDARSGGTSPPEPPGCEETHTNQKSLQRGTELRLDDLTPLWKIKDFPQGASFCLQINLATDLPSPQPHPCHLLSPLDRQNRG